MNGQEKKRKKTHNRFTGVVQYSNPEAGKVKIKSNMNARDEIVCTDRVTNYVTRAHIHNCVTVRY